MKSVIALRDSLRKFYADYGVYLRPVLKFLAAFSFLVILKNYIGIEGYAARPQVIAGLSALCMFFPTGCITFVCALFVTAGMYGISLSLMLVCAVFFLLVLMLYFGFRPGKGLIIILIPIGFILKVPFIVPMVLGLVFGTFSAVPASLGVLGYHMIRFVRDGAGTFEKTSDVTAIMKEFVEYTEALLTDESMIVTMAAFVLTIVIVHLVSRLTVDHAWTIAIFCGLFCLGFMFFFGGSYLGAKIGTAEILTGLLTGGMGAFIYEFIFLNVDYKASEYLQFEDDDYYYYVKAVPKVKAYDEAERKE